MREREKEAERRKDDGHIWYLIANLRFNYGWLNAVPFLETDKVHRVR
jgi:hypothetical protein